MGNGTFRGTGKDDGSSSCQGTKEFGRNDHPSPVRTQAHQVDIGGGQTQGQLRLRSEARKADIAVLGTNGPPKFFGLVAPNAKTKVDAVTAEPASQLKKLLVGVSTAEVARV